MSQKIFCQRPFGKKTNVGYAETENLNETTVQIICTNRWYSNNCYNVTSIWNFSTHAFNGIQTILYFQTSKYLWNHKNFGKIFVIELSDAGVRIFKIELQKIQLKSEAT